MFNKHKFILLLLILLTVLSVELFANCQGCCSHHGGVICLNEVTQCKDKSPLSTKCLDKGCDKCDNSSKISFKPLQEKLNVYDRSLYGASWIDADGDCQNTRDEVLLVYSISPAKFKTPRKCKVIEGKWIDPYSGIAFTSPSDLDIDHIVPIAYAHRIGADKWPRSKKIRFANDLENLLPVWSSLNRSKGLKNPMEWMPPNKAYHCMYLRKWKVILKKYELTQDEKLLQSLRDTSCKEIK